MSVEEIYGIENDSEEDNIKNCVPRLPLSKIKRIARADPDYIITANAAVVATSFATELFVQALVEDALAMAQLNNKNKNSKQARLAYNNLVESVQRREEFQFLEDVIPKERPESLSGKKVKANSEDDQKTLPFEKAAVDSDIDMDDDEQQGEDEEQGEQKSSEASDLQLQEIDRLNHVEDIDASVQKNTLISRIEQADSEDGDASDDSIEETTDEHEQDI